MTSLLHIPFGLRNRGSSRLCWLTSFSSYTSIYICIYCPSIRPMWKRYWCISGKYYSRLLAVT